MVRYALTFVFAAASIGLVVPDAIAQGRRGGGGQFGGGQFGARGGGRGVSALQVVQRSDVQKELGLSDDQIADIQAISEAARGSRGNRGGGRGGFGNFQDMTDEERQEAFEQMRVEREKQQKEQSEKVNEILSTSQKSRLSELTFQLALQQGSIEAAASAAGIDLDEDAREKLRTAQQESREATQAKIAKIQREANKELLTTLMSSKQIERAMGEDFAFEQQQARGPGGRQRGGEAGNARRPDRPTGESADTSDDAGGTRRRRR